MSKLIIVRKGYKKPRNGPLFALGVDRVNNNIFDGEETSKLSSMTDIWKKNAIDAGFGFSDGTIHPSLIQAYKNSTNLFGISKKNNPFSKGNMSRGKTMSAGAKAAIGAGATLVGGLANKGISDGLSSTAGTMVSTLGSTAGNIVGLFNPVAGAVITAGTQVLGGLTNRAFGMKANAAALKAANEGTAMLSNFRSNADNFDAVQGPAAVANVGNVYKGGWFSGRKARRRNAELQRLRMLAQDWANRSVTNNITNLQLDQMNNALANYAALGGLFNMGGINSALDYAQATDDFILSKSKSNEKGMTSPIAGIPSLYAFGGVTDSNGADWSDGMMHINAGGSHEENPNEGVQLGVDSEGTPNLVEEGEVIYDDYVFSNRLTVPEIKKKKDLSQEEKMLKRYSGKTYAEAAKRAEKNSGVTDRPNDSIAKRGFEATLQILATSQEREREKQKLKELQEAIDNMSPEELAALQQLMLAMQQQSQEEAIALQQAQQQQVSPEEMQLMSPEEAQQMGLIQLAQLMQADQLPVAALGGILDTPDNMYPYGGSTKKFKRELRARGISDEEYLRELFSYLGMEEERILKNLEDYKKSPDKWWNDNNFNRDFAERFLSSTEEQLKLRKSLERKYKKGTKNFDYDKLSGHGKAAFDADFQKVLENPDLLKEDKDNQLSISRYEETKPDISFSHFATNEARDSYLPEISLNDKGKLSIKYNDEGTIPQGLSFLDDGVTYDKENKVWKNRAGEVVENPFTKDYGFTDISRNWNNWGYIDNEGNWQSVNAPESSTSGTTDYRFTPTAEWSKDLGDAKDYELMDFYLNNYADFIEALNKGDLAALQRLYTLGEATKSNNPEERRDKNRYFRDDADFNNLKKEDVIGYNPNDSRGGIFGNRYFTDAFGIEAPYSKDYNFAALNNGNLIRVGNEKWNNLSDEEKKKYTQIEGPLTREHLMNNLKWAINQYPENWDPNDKDLYLQGISDNVWGPHHLISNKGTQRYALVDDLGNYRKDANGNIRYINYNPEATYQYYNDGKPIDTQSLGDLNVDTIGVLGGNVENNIGVRRNPDGTWKTYRLTDEQAEKLKQREILNSDERYKTLPQFEDAVGGYNFTPHYFELDDEAYKSAGFDDEGYKAPKTTASTESDPFPKGLDWPYLAAGLALLGALGYNILSPSDYSNANAMIKAGMQAGNYMPIGFNPIPYHIGYKPDDPWFYTSPIIALSNATQRSISNKVAPSKSAETLANSYNTMIALGNALRQALEHNFDKEFKVAGYQTGVDTTNSEGFLKADMANQDAFARAQGFSLEGQKAGYAMKQAIDDAKAAGINAGISGLIGLGNTYALNKYNQDVIKWQLKHNQYPISLMSDGRYKLNSGLKTDKDGYIITGAEGGKIQRAKKNKRKGLNF